MTLKSREEAASEAHADAPAVHNGEAVKSYRSRFRTWVEEQVKGEPEISIKQLTKRALVEFSDRFKLGLLDELMQSMIHNLVNVEVRPNMVRERIRRTIESENAGREPGEEKIRSIFADWYEEIENDRKVQIMALNRLDIDKAVVNRRDRASVELKTVKWLEHLKKRLTNDTTKIGDVWTEKEIFNAYKSFCR